MTVSSENRKAGPFTGNGVTDTFPFVFKVFAATDVVVVSADATGAETTLVLDSDYTLTLNESQNDDPGGSVVTIEPLATGHRLVIISEVPRTNETEITNSGGFYPGVLNPALDKLTILVQQQEEKLSRALLLPVTSEATHADLASALLRVDPISDDVVTVADIAASVTAVAAIDDDVSIVAGHVGSVSTFAAVYQGPAASDPALRNSGDPLLEGDLYFNTVSQSMRSYSGSAWLDYEADAEAAQVAAEAARDAAELAELAAESARDAAIIGAGVYVDEPTGRAAVADGVAFKVQGSGDVAAYEYRRVDAGGPTLIATYPSAAVVDVARATQLITDTETAVYGHVTGAVSFTNYTTAYGYLVPYDCTLKQLRVLVANTGTGDIIICRAGHATTGKHTVESITAVTCSIAGVNTFAIADTPLNAGDMVIYGVKTGGYLRSNSASSTPGLSLTRPTSTGVQVSYTAGSKPAIELTLVKSDRLSAIDDAVTEATARGDSSDTTETLGALTVGTGSPTSLNTWSLGPAAVSAVGGLLTEVRHGTAVISGVVSYLVVIFKPVSGNSFTVDAVIPVSVPTDASGIAVAGLAELGRNIVEVGGRVHVFASNYSSAVAIYSDGAGSGSALSKSTFTVGDAVTLTGTYTNTIMMQYTVEEIAALEHESRITSLEGQVAPLDMIASSIGTTTSTATWTNHSRSFGHDVPTKGLLTKVSVNVAGAGSGEIHHYRNDGGTYTFAAKIPVTTTVDGVTEFDVEIMVEAGDLIAYATKSGAYIRYNAAGTLGFYIETTPTDVGSTVTKTGGARPCVLLDITAPALSEIVADAMALDDRVAVLEAAPTTAVELQHSTPLISADFAGVALPDGWTESGGWTVNNGLIAPVSGGWSTVALSAGYSSLARRRILARIQVNDTASVFGVCTSPQESNGGAVAMVDGTAGKLRLYSWTGSSTPGTYTNEVALPAALVSGRHYTLEVVKNALSVTLTFTDTVTRQSCTVSETHLAQYRQFHGRAGVMFISGAIKVDWLTVAGVYPENLHALIIGDSNSEGNFLPAGEPTWAFQLAALRSVEGDLAVAPRAGDETANFIGRKVHDLLPWLPKYVVLALGTNDTSQSTWRTNMAATIAEIEGLGAEPILCTQIPRTASQALRTAMNADIRNYYFGKYRYIDMAIAVSDSNDGVTWNPIYDYGDGIHANVAGQAVMFQQALADAPFLVR